MTLIMSHTFSEGFVFVTSDTMFRQIEHSEEAYDPETVLVGEAMEIDKTRLLTNNIIVSEGGLTLMTGIINKRLEKMVKKDMFLDDCIPLLHEVWEDMSKVYSDDPFFLNNKDSNYYGYKLSGFYKNGITGEVVLSGGTIEDFKHSSEYETYVSRVSMFAPTQDIIDMSDQLTGPLQEAESLEVLFEKYKNVHAMVAAIHPEMVSDTFKLLSLEKFNGSIVSAVTTFDLSDRVEIYKSILNKNKQL